MRKAGKSKTSKAQTRKSKPARSTARTASAKQPLSRRKPASGKTATGLPPGSLAPERIRQILERLEERYPNVSTALHHKSAWELLVSTILSAQSTDATVNKVTPVLFKKYPTVAAFAALKPEELEPDVRSTGFFRNKSRSVVGAAKAVMENFAGQVPGEMDQLLTLPGVARKTANVVLGSWFKKAVGIVVDTHVHRISRRLELTASDNPKDIEQDLMKVIPQEKWIDFSHQIIYHGRAVCIARKPKCAECNLENLCHAADKTWSTVEIHKSAKP
jgi:endonuclease III